jgi:hypothetical protein
VPSCYFRQIGRSRHARAYDRQKRPSSTLTQSTLPAQRIKWAAREKREFYQSVQYQYQLFKRGCLRPTRSQWQTLPVDTSWPSGIISHDVSETNSPYPRSVILGRRVKANSYRYRLSIVGMLTLCPLLNLKCNFVLAVR